MPSSALFAGQAFDPEHCKVMGAAFEGLLQELGMEDRTDPLCTLVATKIIELGKAGERDPQRLRELALKAIHG
jgi:hypothetical protein